MFVCSQRINIQEIKNHEWFLKNLPTDLVDLADRSYGFEDPNHPTQSIEEIMQIISEAREPEASTGGNYFGDVMDDMDVENDLDPDYDSSGEFVCAMQNGRQDEVIGCHAQLYQTIGGETVVYVKLDGVVKMEWFHFISVDSFAAPAL